MDILVKDKDFAYFCKSCKLATFGSEVSGRFRYCRNCGKILHSLQGYDEQGKPKAKTGAPEWISALAK